MVKTSFMFGFLSLLVSFSAQAQVLGLQSGVHRSEDGCILTIQREASGVTHVMINSQGREVKAVFQNPLVSRGSQVRSIGNCSSTPNEFGPRARGSQVEFKLVNDDAVAATYLTRCGGLTDQVDNRIYWAVSNNHRSLLALKVETLEASGFPAMLKHNTNPISCQRFSKIQ